jgi:hypothetical protein
MSRQKIDTTGVKIWLASAFVLRQHDPRRCSCRFRTTREAHRSSRILTPKMSGHILQRPHFTPFLSASALTSGILAGVVSLLAWYRFGVRRFNMAAWEESYDKGYDDGYEGRESLIYRGLWDVEPIDEWLEGCDEGYQDGQEALEEEESRDQEQLIHC